MQAFTKILISTVILGVAAAGTALADAEQTKVEPATVRPVPISPKELKKPQVAKPMTPDVGNCPDPAVTRIEFRIVSRTNQYSGRVEIVAEVKNLGKEAYRSANGQQSVQLYEIPMGGRSALVGQVAFSNLQPGRSVRVSYTRDWNASSPNEGEFPPSYLAIIAYDPDIRMDSNPNNDDCNMGNNRAERSGSDINGMFR
jgi:hypothetical protein